MDKQKIGAGLQVHECYHFTQNLDTGDIMLVTPNGTVKFIGLWQSIVQYWTCIRNNKPVAFNGKVQEYIGRNKPK